MQKDESRSTHDVFVIRDKKRIDAKLTKDYNTKKLTIEFDSYKFEVNLKHTNWFFTLRELDDIVGKEGYKILCNGTSKNVFAAGFCSNMGDGSVSYRRTKNKQEIIKTLEYNTWNEYTTKEEQEISFFGKKLK